jgi:hypothetical protein
MASYPENRLVDPADLRLPPSRLSGSDPIKLQRQIARHGSSLDEMPPVVVYEAADGVLVIYDGVTRATRAAKLRPSAPIQVEIIGRLNRSYAGLPKVRDKR